MALAQHKYDAFISYRRSDGRRVARWLHRELSGFRVPHTMQDRYGRKLNVYLDTVYERGTSDFYENSVKPALMASNYLLVIATPAAARHANNAEDWIAREIADFASGPNGRNVVVVRGEGEFGDPLPGDLGARFPNIEIVDLRGAGPFSRLNPAKTARLSFEKTKLIAPLLNIPSEEMPKLRQEEEKRQQTLLGAITGATLGVLAAVSALSIFALQSRNQAIRSLEESMFATGSMVALSTELDDSAAGRTRRLLINQGCDLIDNLSSGSGVDPGLTEYVTCKLERARSHEDLGEQDAARARYDEAIAKASERYAALPRPDVADRVIEARQAYAEYLVRQKDDAAADAQYDKLIADMHGFAVFEKRAEYDIAETNALGLQGDIAAARNDHAKAGDKYENAAHALQQAFVLDDTFKKSANLEWLERLYLLAGQQHQDSRDFNAAIDLYAQTLKTHDSIEPPNMTAAIEQTAALANALTFQTETLRGNSTAAQQAKAAALSGIARVLDAKSASADLKRRAADLKTRIEAQQTGN
ncbi:MAG TPA: hypothetical protein VH206_04730 [Xanthobacteraceae bacterium]|jgi:tetratricopeptide (TPR) repeat protein|nr:hypothetical protein [Xanthobacteraceae bacterium]